MSTDDMSLDETLEVRNSREHTLEEMYKIVDNGDLDDDEIEEAREDIDNYALEASIKYEFQVLLSYGGPTETLTAWVESDGNGGFERLSSITYEHSWGTKVGVSNDSALARYFDECLECYYQGQ